MHCETKEHALRDAEANKMEAKQHDLVFDSDDKDDNSVIEKQGTMKLRHLKLMTLTLRVDYTRTKALILNRSSKPRRPTPVSAPECTSLTPMKNRMKKKSMPDSRLTLTGSKVLLMTRRKKNLMTNSMIFLIHSVLEESKYHGASERPDKACTVSTRTNTSSGTE